MREYRLALLLLLALPAICGAQYWFQYGARGGPDSYMNSGAKVTIQTIYGQNPISGSLAFWVGETLSNGAFLQAGYLITNRTGLYPSMCTDLGCSKQTYITKGSAEWFYEYFNSETGQSFLGAVGDNGSAGANGTFHTYGFYSKGSSWYFFMDNTTLGSVNLGTGDSGENGPVAFAEVANASEADTVSIPVIFSNLSMYKGGRFLQVPIGYSYIGYGVGSQSTIQNPYGVEELGNKVNYFAVGSGLPQPRNWDTLWQLGFDLNIVSAYGNISGINQYLAYHTVNINAPPFVYLNRSSRVAFSGWGGYGPGSYSGPSPSRNITLFSNVTEVANWTTQYLLNITSIFGRVSGYGWHDSDSVTDYSINSSEIYTNSTARWSFSGWSNGKNATNESLVMLRPYSLQALWRRQYLLNASSPLGSATGSGWYYSNSTADVGLSELYRNVSAGIRLAFYSWSNGNRNPSINVKMISPLRLHAVFRNQSRVSISATDAYGSGVNARFYSGNVPINNTTFLFDNYTYNITSAYYKGTYLLMDKHLNVLSPSNITFTLPIFNVQVRATDVFGIPLNVPVSMTFLNGTVINSSSGSSGYIYVPDVPYGSASIVAHYGGETINAQAYGGSEARITVVSDLDIAVFAAIVLLGFSMYFYASRRLRHHDSALHGK